MRYRSALGKTFAALAATALVAWAGLAGWVGPLGRPATPAAAATSAGGSAGYWLIANTGQVFQVNTSNYGDLRGVALNRPVVGGAPTADGRGYWLVASDGGIFAYGDAHFHGSTGGIALAKPIVAMAADAQTGGYWMVASDGGVFAFNAPFYGSTGGIPLQKPVIGMAVTPSGHGYWLVASDGGVFAFGDAAFHGSTGGVRLDRPVVGMASTTDGNGYWLVGSDGGIFTFGDAGFHGSTGGVRLDAPVVAMSATASGRGYWLAASDGGVFPFGAAPFLGTAGTGGSPRIVAFMSTNSGFPFPPGSTGYDVSKYNCPPFGNLPPSRTFAVVEIAGTTNGAFNSCYQTEASWSGRNMSAYIFMDPLPSPVPPEAMNGPAGACRGSVTCEAYNYGYYWASHWVNDSRSLGISPTLWWLDVELRNWDTSAAAYPVNDNVIASAVGGLRASGVTPGIYSTSLQWGEITGNQVGFPHIAIWEAGADTVNSPGDEFSAVKVCQGQVPDHLPFAGGTIVAVQYGWTINGQIYSTDPDYACT